MPARRPGKRYVQMSRIAEYLASWIVRTRGALAGFVAVAVLVTPLGSQTAQLEPYSFKDDKLGMSLDTFKMKHHDAGCNEVFQGIIQCGYSTTIAGITPFAFTIFADNKLAAIRVFYQSSESAPLAGGVVSASSVTQQALIEKFGPPTVVRATGRHGFEWSALRWDNDVSVVEFQGSYCGKGDGVFRSNDITEILEGRYCENGDEGDGSTSLWYIHKELTKRFLARQKEAGEKARQKALSDI